jgi:hypothetical protein
MRKFPKQTSIFASHALTLSFSLAAGLLVTRCDPGVAPAPAAPQKETGAGPAVLSPEKQADFVKEVMTLKSTTPDPSEYDRAARELFARYGIAAPATQEAWHPLVPDLASSASPEPGATGLAKNAALTTVWKKVKSLDINFPFVVMNQVDVENNDIVTAWTGRLEASADPFLVAFYMPSGSLKNGPIQVIGLDDDSQGNLNSRIQWQNNTGETQHVFVVAFAYGPAFTGRVRLKIATAMGTVIRTGRIAASRVFANNSAFTTGCHGPFNTRLELQLVSGGFYGTGILGVDVVKMQGANVWDIPATAYMGFVLTPIGLNFVLPYLQDLDGNTYDNGNHYFGYQEDQYTCDVF